MGAELVYYLVALGIGSGSYLYFSKEEKTDGVKEIHTDIAVDYELIQQAEQLRMQVELDMHQGYLEFQMIDSLKPDDLVLTPEELAEFSQELLTFDQRGGAMLASMTIFVGGVGVGIAVVVGSVLYNKIFSEYTADIQGGAIAMTIPEQPSYQTLSRAGGGQTNVTVRDSKKSLERVREQKVRLSKDIIHLKSKIKEMVGNTLIQQKYNRLLHDKKESWMNVSRLINHLEKNPGAQVFTET